MALEASQFTPLIWSYQHLTY